MKSKDILITCEESQEVTKAFRAKGHNAFSNDLQQCSGGFFDWHLQADSIKVLEYQQWDFVGAHPPCTYITNSGVRWLYYKDGSKNIERC